MLYVSHHRHARRRMQRLYVAFLGTLIAIAAATTCTVTVIVSALATSWKTIQLSDQGRFILDAPISLWNWDICAIVTLILTGTTILAYAVKRRALRNGCTWTAERLDGKRINPATPSGDARVLLSVINNLALAAGLTPPLAYLLHREPGINAFVAGTRADDAIIGITQGAITHLNRHELQGFVGRLLGQILDGQLLVNAHADTLRHSVLGMHILGTALWRQCQAQRRRWKRNIIAHTALPLATGYLLAGMLLLCGIPGRLACGLFSLLVCRREAYRADAATARLLRHSDGLASALRTVLSHHHTSEVRHPCASENAAMWVCPVHASRSRLQWLTHPSIDTRLRRIEPSPGLTHYMGDIHPELQPLHAAASTRTSGEPQPFTSTLSVGTYVTTEELIRQIGMIHLEHVHTLLDLQSTWPTPVLNALREPFGARALVCNLFWAEHAQTRRHQRKQLSLSGDPLLFQEVCALEPQVSPLVPTLTLPLIHVAIPTLTLLSHEQYTTFKTVVNTMLPHNDPDALLSWVASHVLFRQLDTRCSPQGHVHTSTSKGLTAAHCQELLSALAHRHTGSAHEALTAFRAGVIELGIPSLTLTLRGDASLATINAALSHLNECPLHIRHTFIRACCATIRATPRLPYSSAELLRAVAHALGLPMAPLWPTSVPSSVPIQDAPSQAASRQWSPSSNEPAHTPSRRCA